MWLALAVASSIGWDLYCSKSSFHYRTRLRPLCRLPWPLHPRHCSSSLSRCLDVITILRWGEVRFAAIHEGWLPLWLELIRINYNMMRVDYAITVEKEPALRNACCLIYLLVWVLWVTSGLQSWGSGGFKGELLESLISWGRPLREEHFVSQTTAVHRIISLTLELHKVTTMVD